MGKKSSKAPQMPDPIDPGKAQGEYLFGQGFQSNYRGITDPRLQQKLLDSEARYRPQYSALELADINTMWEGFEDVSTSPQYQSLQAELAGLEAGAAVSNLTTEERRAALGEQYDLSRGKLSETGKATSNWAGIMGVMGGKSNNRSSGRNRKSGKKGKKGAQNDGDSREAYINAGMVGTNDREARKAEIKTRMGEMEKMGGVKGYKSLLADASRQSGMLEREMLGLQRADDVSALEEFAPQVVEAYRAADPYSTGLADKQTAMANDLYQRAQGLNPEQQRIVDQQALGMAQQQGRITDQSAVAGQLLGRENYLSGLRGQAAGMGQQAFGMNRQIAGDLGSTILGRPSSAIGLGQSGLGQSIGLAAQPVGPQLFDPNMGINMAMQQQSNEVNYAGAMAQANASKSSGMMGMVGSIAGGFASSAAGSAFI